MAEGASALLDELRRVRAPRAAAVLHGPGETFAFLFCQLAARVELASVPHAFTLLSFDGACPSTCADQPPVELPDANERRFRESLDYTARESSGLLINGDLFELRIAYRSVVPRKHVRVLAKIADVVEVAFRSTFVGGNHDYVE